MTPLMNERMNGSICTNGCVIQSTDLLQGVSHALFTERLMKYTGGYKN
jgi:hypothetical protein